MFGLFAIFVDVFAVINATDPILKFNETVISIAD
jgi:hypothetical protein